MNVSVRMVRSVPVLTLAGRLDATGAGELDEQLHGLSASHVVLDVQVVKYRSSMGVRSLIVGQQGLRRQSGGLLLVGLPQLVQRVLEMSGILGEFQRFDSAAAAVDAAAAARAVLDASSDHTFDDRVYRVGPPSTEPCAIEIWGGAPQGEGGATPFACLNGGGAPLDATLDELGVAFGAGGLGGARSQDAGSMGAFVAIGNVAAVLPVGGRESDFVVSDRPDETGVCVAGAVGFAGPATRTIDWTASTPVALRVVVQDLAAILGAPPLVGFVMRTKSQGADAVVAGVYSP